MPLPVNPKAPNRPLQRMPSVKPDFIQAALISQYTTPAEAAAYVQAIRAGRVTVYGAPNGAMATAHSDPAGTLVVDHVTHPSIINLTNLGVLKQHAVATSAHTIVAYTSNPIAIRKALGIGFRIVGTTIDGRATLAGAVQP